MARCTLILSAVLYLAGQAISADPPPLRWGTDPTGGAPYIYRVDDKYVGFEVDIAEYLAAKLGRASKMVDGDWSNLPNQLGKPADVEKGIDIVLNGYELRADLLKDYSATRPYYVYRLVLMTHREGKIANWNDLLPNPDRPPPSVCVLGGSVAHRYVKKGFEGVKLSTNNDVANVIGLVSKKRLDATVQDNPAASYYLKQHPELQQSGESVNPGFYVAYYRKDDVELGKKLDAAIAEGLRDGTFKRIYQKYGLWNEEQERLWHWLEQPWPPAVEEVDDLPDEEEEQKTDPWPSLFRELLHAAGVTIFLSFASFPFAMAIGLLVALTRVFGPRWLSVPAGIYVEVIRGTPLLLQLFMIYYLVPELLFRSEVSQLIWLGRQITPFVAAIIGLAINYSAYEAENYRAGLLAVPHGQVEAALALGIPRWTAIRRVVVPQAVRTVIPPVTNDFIALFKDTSACSVILVVELTRKYNELFNFHRELVVQLAFLTAGMYLLMSYPLALVARQLERKTAAKPGAGK